MDYHDLLPTDFTTEPETTILDFMGGKRFHVLFLRVVISPKKFGFMKEHKEIYRRLA